MRKKEEYNREDFSELDKISVSEELKQRTLEVCKNSKYKRKPVYINRIVLALACSVLLLIVSTTTYSLTEKFNNKEPKLVTYKDKSIIVDPRENRTKENTRENPLREIDENIKKQENNKDTNKIAYKKSENNIPIVSRQVPKIKQVKSVPICVEYSGDEDTVIKIIKGKDSGEYEIKEDVGKVKVAKSGMGQASYLVCSSSEKLPLRGNLDIEIYKGDEKVLVETYGFLLEENTDQILIKITK